MQDRVDIFDTSLRDGEQAAGSRLDVREKLDIAHQLARLNVDIIEAGFPQSSPQDFEAVHALCSEIDGPVICALSRAVLADIDRCGAALKAGKRTRIHTGLGVSDIHVMGKFGDAKYGKTMAEKKARLLKMAVAAVRHAKGFTPDVEFYAEDSGRADRAFLFEVLQGVIEAGAIVLNIPDTTGYAVPEQYGALIREIRTKVPGADKVTLSAHCHNDLGMAVANSLAAVLNGARQVEGTINGIGERAGNAAIEEVVMALRTRRDVFNVDTRINAKEFYRTSRMVAEAMHMSVPPNKAIIGSNAFAHSSGIHVDGVLKQRATYEIMSPDDVGMGESRVVLTARTGHHGLKHRLEKLGHRLTDSELDRVYQRFLIVADKKREVFDEDLTAIMRDEIHPVPETFRLESLQTMGGTGTIPTATVRIRQGEKVHQQAACGDGPIDAAYSAISLATGITVKLTGYDIRAISAGTEAMGEVTVRLEPKKGSAVTGRGASTDIIEASAKAYLDGLNRIVAERG
ncbi:MAG: 2-isopropylmalate synthase [Verrucomicrobia bacterium]|nr:2-isopropylmalate synthase [Verrucomicrobiota bacterium]